ncbi:transposase [Chryseobacterium sp. RU37D]|uniref:transposase n=1 Tax=Chryseobacterium sp. RU37D TaxID=1907397 RepID=UPI00117F122A
MYKISRANFSGICSSEEIKPASGYCAEQKTRYFGYKLHAVCDKNGIFHSSDFPSANIHDINYFNDIK